MTQKMSFRILFVCVLGLVFVLAACGGPSLKDQIIGKWKGNFESSGTSMAATLEFAKEGKMNMIVDVLGQALKVEGTYTWSDSKTINIELKPEGADPITGSLEVKVDGDTLTLTDKATNDAQELKRVQE